MDDIYDATMAVIGAIAKTIIGLALVAVALIGLFGFSAWMGWDVPRIERFKALYCETP